MPEQPIFKAITHIAVVVKDLDQAIEKYWKEYGIGPWAIYTFDPSTVDDMILRDERVDHACRLAEAQIGGVGLELIQPLDNRSLYAEFLNEHGEGLHHVGFAVDNYEQMMTSSEGKGVARLHGGEWYGATFSYLDSRATLSFISEVATRPEGWRKPPPEATYP